MEGWIDVFLHIMLAGYIHKLTYGIPSVQDSVLMQTQLRLIYGVTWQSDIIQQSIS